MSETLDHAETVEEPGQRAESPRDRMMRDIADRAEARRVAEMVSYAEAVGAEPPASAEENPESVATEQIQSDPVFAEPPNPEPVATPQLRTVELDGQAYQVNEDQYAQLARMGMIAQSALANYRPEVPHPVQTAQFEPVVPDALALVHKIQYGSPDEAAQALGEYTKAIVSSIPRVDPDAIAADASARARADAQLLQDTATIKAEYPEIFDNPQRQFLAGRNVEAIRRRNAAFGYRQTDLEIYREAGNAVREAMLRPGTGNEPAIQAARQETVERKRAAPTPTRALDLRSPPPTPARQQSASDVVDQMRKARGLPSLR